MEDKEDSWRILPYYKRIKSNKQCPIEGQENIPSPKQCGRPKPYSPRKGKENKDSIVSTPRLIYKPKPYRPVKVSAPKSNLFWSSPDTLKSSTPVLNSPWLSTRYKDPGFELDKKADASPAIRPKNVPPGIKVIQPVVDPYFQESLKPFKEKRYSCSDCQKWYHSNPVYASDETHIQLTCRHRKPPRPITPPQYWNIGFTDSESD